MPTSDPSSCRRGLCWRPRCHLSPPWFSGVWVETRRITFLITCKKDVNKRKNNTWWSLLPVIFQSWMRNVLVIWLIHYFSTDEVTIVVHIVFLGHRIAWDILCLFSLQAFVVSIIKSSERADSNLIKQSFTITTPKHHLKREPPRQKKAECQLHYITCHIADAFIQSDLQ